jgi:hypothetical protein
MASVHLMPLKPGSLPDEQLIVFSQYFPVGPSFDFNKLTHFPAELNL